MPPLKTYDLFISHAWEYNSEYYRLVNLLSGARLFKWRNYSVPEHDPLFARTNSQLESELDQQIRPVNAVLIISGMYVNYRRWIDYEIQVAEDYRKPIIGIIPWGGERTPVRVREVSDAMVRWNTQSIVDAIRTHAI